MKKLGKWWAGLRLTCEKCGERLELEESDKIAGGGKFYSTTCSACGHLIEVKRPTWG